MNFLFSKKSLSAGSSMLDLIMGVSAVGVIGGILFAVMTFGPSSEDSIETTETSADAPGGPGGPGGRPVLAPAVNRANRKLARRFLPRR